MSIPFEKAIVYEISLKYRGPFWAAYIKDQNLLNDIVLELSVKVGFRARTYISLNGSYRNKLKGASYSEL